MIAVGINVPWDLWEIPAQAQRSRLEAIADAGIDHLFTADHVSFHDGSGMDGPVVLAALSGIEPRLGLHLGVWLLALRHPMVAARQIASLSQAAPGRIRIGVGVGGEDRHEFEVCGIDPRSRGRRTDAAITIVRSLLDGAVVHGDGEFWDFEAGSIQPKPSPRIPFHIGGRSDAALDRAGRLGDGWLGLWCAPRRFKEAIGIVEARARRPVDGWSHGLQAWVGVGDSPADARRHVGPAIEAFYKVPFDRFERYTPMGTPAQIAGELQPYVDAGVTHFNLTACGANPTVEYESIAAVREILNS